MTCKERDAMLAQIKELCTQIKELVANYPDQRVTFCPDGEFEWNGEEYEHTDFRIYSGSNWYVDDEVDVSAIYVEDDELLFDALYSSWNYKGNCVDCDEEMEGLYLDLILSRAFEDAQLEILKDTLEFIVSLLHEKTEE